MDEKTLVGNTRQSCGEDNIGNHYLLFII